MFILINHTKHTHNLNLQRTQNTTVTKSGDTRIGLVGFPSVGKSTLLTSLTGTRSEAAACKCVMKVYWVLQ